MKAIIVERPKPEKIEGMGIPSWPIWEKEVSKFDWYYDTNEICLILDGQATVTGEDCNSVTFGKGDLVTFPQGLSCTWNITSPIRKYYKFG
ncbi:MAG: cupin domain-containing protein [Candidatus Omnitrophica bacterium]|jgi:hypothetical protein|nr:cupin domain-containing protein [Candidatus Omnitrophota bacterium]